MGSTVNFSFDKATAMKLARKAISSKMAVLSVSDSLIKAGTPPLMVVKLKFSDNSVEFSGSKVLLGAAKNAVELEFDEHSGQNNASASSQQVAKNPNQFQDNQAVDPAKYLEYQEKTIQLLKQYKNLLDENVLSQEEYELKKEELLNFLKGVTLKK